MFLTKNCCLVQQVKVHFGLHLALFGLELGSALGPGGRHLLNLGTIFWHFLPKSGGRALFSVFLKGFLASDVFFL